MKKIAVLMLVGLSWIATVSPVEAKGPRKGTKPRKPTKPVVKPVQNRRATGEAAIKELLRKQN